jgi:hypothetical protein
MNIDQQLNGNQNRRMANEARYLAQSERREDAAREMLGELCREGKTVYYAFPVGGKYREGTRGELINFLIRNNYA